MHDGSAPMDTDSVADSGAPDGSGPRDAPLPIDGAETDADLDVNDVAILFPWTAGAAGDLMPMSDFLSAAQYDTLVGDVDIRPRRTPLFEWFRIVGVVLDPCARAHASDVTCTHELRLVAQAVETDLNLNVDDLALHLIYRYDDAAFDRLVSEWLRARTESGGSTRGRPLGVHPVLSTQGTRGTFGTAMTALVRSWAREEHLRLVAGTFVATTRWPFFRATVASGTLTREDTLPCVPESVQNIFQDLGSPIIVLLPRPTCADSATDLLQRFDILSAAEQDAAISSALRVLNPDRVGLSDTDCVACHAVSRRLSQLRGLDFLSLADGHPDRFVPPRDVTATFEDATHAPTGNVYPLRAFGYANAAPSITPRMVNVATRSVEWIRSRFATRL
jgi:hypothetical protein